MCVLGYVSEPEKRDTLDPIDVFIHPSYGEGQPMAVLEARATGTPVVISNRCALPEIVAYEARIITEPSAHGVSTAIEDPHRDIDQRQTMWSNATCLVNEEFTWRSVVDEYELLYQELVSDSE